MIKQYRFQYLPDNTNVYYIGKRLSTRSYAHIMYTEPHISKEKKDVTNVLIGYCNEMYAHNKRSNIDTDCDILCEPLTNMKYLSQLYKLPLIVEINTFCDIEDAQECIEAYYYFNGNDQKLITT